MAKRRRGRLHRICQILEVRPEGRRDIAQSLLDIGRESKVVAMAHQNIRRRPTKKFAQCTLRTPNRQIKIGGIEGETVDWLIEADRRSEDTIKRFLIVSRIQSDAFVSHNVFLHLLCRR
jgi:hypothetical protein